jgi:hypothetical protein
MRTKNPSLILLMIEDQTKIKRNGGLGHGFESERESVFG